MLSTQFLSEDSGNILEIIQFNAILNLAIKRDKTTLQKFINQGKGGELDRWIYNHDADTSPIRFLAANGDDESVDFLIENTNGKLKEELINAALQGYAIVANHEKVDLFLANYKGDVNKAVLGYIKGKHIERALDFVTNRKADAKYAFFQCAIRAYKQGIDSEYASGVQVLIFFPDVAKAMHSVFDHIFDSYDSRHKSLVSQNILHLFSCITDEEMRKQAVIALNDAQQYDGFFTSEEISIILKNAEIIHCLMRDKKDSFQQAMMSVEKKELSIIIKEPSNLDNQLPWQQKIVVEPIPYTHNQYKDNISISSISNKKNPEQPILRLLVILPLTTKFGWMALSGII